MSGYEHTDTVEVRRDPCGDVWARKTSGQPMTVAELIIALQSMPPSAVVKRYCDRDVHDVTYEAPSIVVEIH